MGKYWLLLLLGVLSSVKEKYFSLLLASIELLRTQHHGEEVASAHSEWWTLAEGEQGGIMGK